MKRAIAEFAAIAVSLFSKQLVCAAMVAFKGFLIAVMTLLLVFYTVGLAKALPDDLSQAMAVMQQSGVAAQPAGVVFGVVSVWTLAEYIAGVFLRVLESWDGPENEGEQ